MSSGSHDMFKFWELVTDNMISETVKDIETQLQWRTYGKSYVVY